MKIPVISGNYREFKRFVESKNARLGDNRYFWADSEQSLFGAKWEIIVLTGEWQHSGISQSLIHSSLAEGGIVKEVKSDDLR